MVHVHETHDVYEVELFTTLNEFYSHYLWNVKSNEGILDRLTYLSVEVGPPPMRIGLIF